MSLTHIDWEREGVLVLSFTGRMTLGEGTRLLRKLIADALEAGRKDILLNLGEVFYIDSSVLGELIAAHKAVARQDGRLKLAKLTARTQELMQLTKLHTVFEIYDNEDAAVRSFHTTR